MPDLSVQVSCLSWSPTQEGMLWVGDGDGVITILHTAIGHQVEVDAHAGVCGEAWGVGGNACACGRKHARVCTSDRQLIHSRLIFA